MELMSHCGLISITMLMWQCACCGIQSTLLCPLFSLFNIITYCSLYSCTHLPLVVNKTSFFSSRLNNLWVICNWPIQTVWPLEKNMQDRISDWHQISDNILQNYLAWDTSSSIVCIIVCTSWVLTVVIIFLKEPTGLNELKMWMFVSVPIKYNGNSFQ